MIQVYIRALTVREAEELRQVVGKGSPSPSHRELGLGCLLRLVSLLCLLGLLGVVAWNPHQAITTILATVAILGGIVCFFLGGNMVQGFFRWKRYGQGFKRDLVPKIVEALADGQVEVKRVVANRVIAIEEFEDEGPGYIFDIGDGQTLVLKGQKYELDDPAVEWPNTDFEIVRTMKHDLWVGLFCSGRRLDPSQTIKSESCTEDFIWSEQERVLNSTPETFLNTILKGGAPA